MPISTIGSNSLNQTSDLTINGQTVGKGGGNVATNTAHGVSALNSNTTATQNTSVGYQAGYSGTTTTRVTAVGYQAGYGVSVTGATNDSTAVGNQALYTGGGGGDVAIGSKAMYAANTNAGAGVAVGGNSLLSCTTGYYNVAVGYNSAYSTTTGISNIAIGKDALYNNTTGNSNTVVGHQAGFTSSTGLYNTFIGTQAGYTSAVNGNSGNTCVGFQSGYGLTTGIKNTFIGGNANVSAGYYVTTGSSNTIIGGYTGNQDGLDIRTTSNYIVLSDGDGAPRLIGSNSGNWGIGGKVSTSKLYLYVNTGATADALVSQPDANATVNAYVFKNSSAGNAGYIQYNSTTTSYVTSSDYRLKENIAPMTGALAKVAQLKPVTYDWKSGGSSQGFIAHELAEVVPDCVTGEKDALDKDGNPDYQGIDTSFLVATLTAAIQELKALVDAQATEIAELKAKVAP